jgi:hypothetical protein
MGAGYKWSLVATVLMAQQNLTSRSDRIRDLSLLPDACSATCYAKSATSSFGGRRCAVARATGSCRFCEAHLGAAGKALNTHPTAGGVRLICAGISAKRDGESF